MNTIPESTNKSLSRNFLLLLKPLVRVLLRTGIGFATFAEWVKFAYVDIAEKEFTLEGRPQSTSRIAILSGLHRKEVARIRSSLSQAEPSFANVPANRAERVINAWLRETGYQDEKGKAKIIPLTGADISFEELSKLASGDIHTATILDELLRIASVEIIEGNQLRLITQGYIPQATSPQQLDIFGQSAYDLLATLDNNINPHSTERRLQRSVAYKHLPPEVLDEFQQFSRAEGEKLLVKLNSWLAERDLSPAQQEQADIQYRAGVGIYYFEEENSMATDASKEKAR